jgi:hypothetical protein
MLLAAIIVLTPDPAPVDRSPVSSVRFDGGGEVTTATSAREAPERRASVGLGESQSQVPPPPARRRGFSPVRDTGDGEALDAPAAEPSQDEPAEEASETSDLEMTRERRDAVLDRVERLAAKRPELEKQTPFVFGRLAEKARERRQERDSAQNPSGEEGGPEAVVGEAAMGGAPNAQ